MDPDLVAALQITLIGMALVFLTLIIIAVIINLLDRLFRERATEAAAAPMVVPTMIATPVATSSVMQPGATEGTAVQQYEAPSAQAAAPILASDLAALIAVVLASATAGQHSSRPPMEKIEKPWENQTLSSQTVTVITVNAGAPVWSGYGRRKAME